MSLVYADGVETEEKAVIKQMIALFGLNPNLAIVYREWAKSILALISRGGIDPSVSFPCTRCGLCCRNIGEISTLKSFHSGDGVCMYYRQEVGRTIYFSRPLICRIDEAYNQIFKDMYSLVEYYEMNQVCNRKKMKPGCQPSYRVRIDEQ